MQCSRCNRNCRRKRSAFSLIEVVAGLVIMAGVLVASLLGFSAHRRQLRHADNRIAAVSIADELLTTLSGQVDGFPTNSRGRIAGKSDWYWTTQLVATTAPMEVPMNVIRLSVVTVESSGKHRLLTSVDVVEGGI